LQGIALSERFSKKPHAQKKPHDQDHQKYTCGSFVPGQGSTALWMLCQQVELICRWLDGLTTAARNPWETYFG